MKVRVAPKLPKLTEEDVVVYPVWNAKVPIGVNPLLLRFFEGEHGETAYVVKEGRSALLLGLEKGQSKREAYAQAARALRKHSFASCFLLEATEEALEGFLLGSYSFTAYKKANSEPLAEVVAVSSKMQAADVKKVFALSQSVYFARDLINENADDVNPQRLVQEAKKIAKRSSSVSIKILGPKQLAAKGLNLIEAVGRASSYDQQLILATYKGSAQAKKHPLLVGKGVTYDTGGLNLKSNMLTMKCDMGGAAAVLGVLDAAVRLKLKCTFSVLIPAVENAVSARSFKPGDVFKSYAGKTVEIGNTDAEGRLILADALAYGIEQLKPTAAIDVATLTGAMVVALGHEVTGYFSSCETLTKELEKASVETEEPLCRLPLIEPLRKELKSDIADLKNIAGRDAGAVKAALFLQEFVSDVPWAHLDIAGTAFRSKEGGVNPKHGTGASVRLLTKYLERQ